MTRVLVRTEALSKTYTIRRGLLWQRPVGQVRAVDGVDFQIREGEVLGFVGGSGSGKSTLGRLILGLIPADAGEVWFDGEPLSGVSPDRMRLFRRDMQMVFQNPLASLNPRRTIAENVARPLYNFATPRAVAQRRVAELLDLVGLDPVRGERYPHEFSGGQCQRVAIARALALAPRFLFLDEPVSALDVSVQAQILNLLSELQGKLNLTYLFVSHDLPLVHHFADRIMVMYRGRIVETGPAGRVYHDPYHPFTRQFLALARLQDAAGAEDDPLADEDLEDPNLGATGAPDDGPGCRYASACPLVHEPCRHTAPALQTVDDDHAVACHLHHPAPAAAP